MGAILIQQGQVWFIRVPFIDDPEKSKERPAMIIGWTNLDSMSDPSILMVPITSFGDGGLPSGGDIFVGGKLDGLKSGAYVRSSRPLTIHPRILIREGRPKGTLDLGVIKQVRGFIERAMNPNGLAKL